jgi:DHA2 family multidrug resistance protein
MKIVNKWLIAITVILPTLIEIIDTSVVNVSLGNIRGGLSAGIEESTWVITSYLVSNAIIIPMAAWFGRMFGRKRYLIFSIGLFTLSSFFCGSAWSLASLVFFRIIQGLGGGALVPLSQAILLETFPPEEHGMAMAIFGMGVVFGPIVGPLMGGWVTDQWSWHWIFFINIPIGIISIVMASIFISDPPYLKANRPAKIDAWGIFLLTVGLGSLQIVLDKGQQENWFSSVFILRLSILAVLALACFVIVERFTDEPIVHLEIFRDRSFTAGNLVQFATFFTLFGAIVLLPVYLQNLMGYTAFRAGLVLGPGGLVTLIMLPVVGRLVIRIHPRIVLIAGLLTGWIAIKMMSQFTLDADFPSIILSRVILGIAMPCIFVPLTNLTLSQVPKEKMGNATGIYNLLRNLGASFGIAFVTTMLSRRTQFHQVRLSEHLTQLNRIFQEYSARGTHILHFKGFASAQAGNTYLGVVYKELMRQAMMKAINDTFFLSSIILLCVISLVFFLRKGKNSTASTIIEST